MNSDKSDADTLLPDVAAVVSRNWRVALGSVLTASNPLADPLSLIRSLVECARVHGGASTAAFTVPFHDGNWVRVVVASGGFAGWEDRLLPFEGSVTALAVKAGHALVIDEVALDERTGQTARSTAIGPAVVAPAYVGGGFRGALMLGRPPGQGNFGEVEREMTAAFVDHAVLALLALQSGTADRHSAAGDVHDVAVRVYGHVAGKLFGLTSSLCSLRSQVPEALSKRIDAAIMEADRIATHARVVAGDQASTERDRPLDAALSAFGTSVAEHGLVGNVDFDSSWVHSGATMGLVARWIPEAVSIAARFGITRAVSLDLAARHIAGALVIATVRYRGWLPEGHTKSRTGPVVDSWFDAGSDGDAGRPDDDTIALRLMVPEGGAGRVRPATS